MPPQDQQKLNKARGPIIESVMRNPKLSRIIHEAASAPLGSTKRDKAKAIISILNKTDPSRKGQPMGMGGPGDMYTVKPGDTLSSIYGNNWQQTSGYTGDPTKLQVGTQLPAPASSVTIFPSAPKMKTSSPQSSVPGSISKMFSDYYSAKPTYGFTAPKVTTPAPSYTSGNSITGSIGNWFKSIFSPTAKPAPSSTGMSLMDKALGVSSPSTNKPDTLVHSNVSNAQSVSIDPANMSVAPVNMSVAPKTSSGTSGGTKTSSSSDTKGPVAPVTSTSTNNDPNGYSEAPLQAKFTGHGIINTNKGSVNISSYATDPNHETAVLGIYNTINDSVGEITDANTAQAIITQLAPKSPVTGQMVMDAATKFGVDPALLISIMQQDSTLGTKGLGVKTNNPGNVGNDGTKGRTYNTLEGGVNAVAQWIAKHPATGNGPADTGSTGDTSGGGNFDYVAAYNAAPSYITQNVGPELFAKIMQGASLTDQENALADTLKGSFDLDNLLAKKNALEAENPTIKQDMTDYIKSRDTYISNIDGMLDNVNSAMATTDISNPVTNKMYQDYKNYLLTLKGRQNQRYGQYLNNSIEQYNSDLTQVQNQYTNAVSAYQDALKSGNANIKDTYDETHKILTDMYNTLQDGPTKLLQRQKAQLDYNQALLDNAASIGGYKPNYLPEQNAYADKVVDKTTGELIPGVSLPGLIQQLSIDQTYNPVGVLDLFTNGALTKLKSMASSKDPSAFKDVQEYMQQLDAAINPATSNLSPEVVQQIAARVADMKQSLIDTVGGSVKTSNGTTTGTGLTGYLMDNYSTVEKIAKELSGEKLHWYSAAKPIPTREQLISEYSNIDPEVVGAIYDSDQLAKSQLGDGYTILNGLQKVTIPNNTSGGNSLVGLSPEEQMARYLTARIMEPFKYNSVLNQ